MKKALIVLLLLSFALPAQSLSLPPIDYYVYNFHCEGEEVLCGGNLSGNYTLKEIGAHELWDEDPDKNLENRTEPVEPEKMRKLSKVPLKIDRPDSEYIHSLRTYKNIKTEEE